MTRKQQFVMNINNIEAGMAIYTFVESNAKYMDASILLREQYTMIISALDTYLHGVVEDYMVTCIFDNSMTKIADFNIQLSVLKTLNQITDEEIKKIVVRNHIRERLHEFSFQSPTSMEYVFKYLGIKHGWKQIGNVVSMKPEDVRNTLALCVNRRNKITHESDWNPVSMSYDGITIQDVTDCKVFITSIVEAIDQKLQIV